MLITTLLSLAVIGSEDMFLVVEEKDSRCFRLNSPLLFIPKGHGLKAYGMSQLRSCSHALKVAIGEKTSKTVLERRGKKRQMQSFLRYTKTQKGKIFVASENI